jgi:hypothetical protein
MKRMNAEENPVVWKSKQKMLATSKLCAVCLDEYQTLEKLLNCTHEFCKRCTKILFKRDSSCPLCRANLYSIEYLIQMLEKPMSSDLDVYTKEHANICRLINKVKSEPDEAYALGKLLYQNLEEAQYRDGRNVINNNHLERYFKTKYFGNNVEKEFLFRKFIWDSKNFVTSFSQRLKLELVLNIEYGKQLRKQQSIHLGLFTVKNLIELGYCNIFIGFKIIQLSNLHEVAIDRNSFFEVANTKLYYTNHKIGITNKEFIIYKIISLLGCDVYLTHGRIWMYKKQLYFDYVGDFESFPEYFFDNFIYRF